MTSKSQKNRHGDTETRRHGDAETSPRPCGAASPRLRFASFLLIAIFFVGGSGSSQATQQGKGQAQETVHSVVAKQAALVSEFDVNGLKVLLKRREGSLTVATGLFIRGGSANINAQNAGIETLMLSVATEATTNFPRARMRSELSRMGTVIGSSSNNDYSVLSLATTRMHFDRSWQIFTDVVLRPSFTKEDVALVQERQVVSLSDDTDNPDVYLQRLQERVAYAGHPYLNSTNGTPESVAKLTPDDLRKYHTKLMETSRLLLVIVGDLNPAEVKELVTASFGKLPRGTYKSETMPQLAFDKSSVDVTPRELPTNYIQGLFTAPSLTSPDIYAMRIASSLLRDRVFEEVRVKRNLSYAPDAFLRTQAANVGGLYVTAVDANQSIRLMLTEITRLQNEPVSKDDIQAVIAQYLTTYYLGQETNAAQAGELAQYELIGGGWRNSVDFLERLSAVTPADIQRVSQKYMKNIRFVVLGNPRSIDTGVFTGQAG
ncbi:MAG TPA: pitrilysin family protein [Pyrinomonadaceae bacterium]|nr:pitrilysin family protein [Pyrinomonadaceae bacterium]